MAFIFAAALHLTAVALAAHRQDGERQLPDSDRFTDIDVEPDEQMPIPPPPDIPFDPPPFPTSPQDFVEDQTPPRVSVRPTGPIHPPGVARPHSGGNPKAWARNAPRPVYPYEARRRHLTGSGVARLTVDSASGVVLQVTMQQSTGSSILDESAESAFRNWRFQPGVPSTVIIPVTYTLSGATY